jgi:hypothetical protein
VQERKERVRQRRQEVAWVYLFCECVERLGVFDEVSNVEDRLGIGEFVFGQVGVEACFW